MVTPAGLRVEDVLQTMHVQLDTTLWREPGNRLYRRRYAYEVPHDSMALCTSLEFLHQILPDRPHPRPFAVNVHWDGRQQAGQLDASNSNERVFCPVSSKPAIEEEGEDEAVKDVCCNAFSIIS